jgi:hypothetical protein
MDRLIEKHVRKNGGTWYMVTNILMSHIEVVWGNDKRQYGKNIKNWNRKGIKHKPELVGHFIELKD